MPIVIFNGRVFPQVSSLTINPPIELGFRDHPALGSCELQITIKQGTVTVVCQVSRFDFDRDSALLYKEAYELSGVMINLYTFATGNGTTIVFDTIKLPDGRTTELRPANQLLARHCTAFSLDGRNIGRILELAMAEPLVHFALRDLNDCFAPNRTTLNCARVIETIRTLIHYVPADGDRRSAWVKMQRVLNVSDGYLKFISDHSLSHRHGSYEPVDGPTNDEIIHRTWEIMNRFLEFRLRGNQPLSEPEFPRLTGAE